MKKPGRGPSRELSEGDPANVRRSDSASARRALRPGVYTLVSYRIVRRDKKGTRWHLSATESRGVSRFAIVAGKTKALELDPAVAVDVAARRVTSGVRVQASVTGESEAGLTIYRNSRRIAVEYRILDRQGALVASGPMKYG